MNPLTNTLYDIAIIGAGVAGSYCANALQQAGYQVCLLEKGRGTGGRASSRRLASADNAPQQSCDLGAPFFHQEFPQLTKDIDHWLAAGVIAPWPVADNDKGLAFTGTPSMSALTRYLSRHCEVFSSQRVSHIDRIDDVWQLRDERYQLLLQAKRVVITAPAAQSAQLLTSADAPQEWLQQAHRASRQCRPQWAAVVSDEGDNDSLISGLFNPLDVEHPVLTKIICDSAKPERQATKQRWVIQANLDWSEANKDIKAEVVAEAMLAAFNDLLTAQTEIKINAVIATPHLWRLGRHQTSNQQALSMPCDPVSMLWNKECGLAVAADWLGTGTVASAMLGAQQLSAAIIADKP
ncbi:FAD-dependent oxidoreductase [Pseudomonadales bacterium]|nr:FAD-dependent oxidoreductase [Pseudomonadales bacterium]